MISKRTERYLAVYKGIIDDNFLKILLADPGCIYVDEPFTTYLKTLITMFESPPPAISVMPRTHQIIETIKSGGDVNGCVGFWMNFDVKEYSPMIERVGRSVYVDWINGREEVSEAYGFNEAPNMWVRGSCSNPAKVRTFEQEVRQFMKPLKIEAIALYGRHRRVKSL